MKFNTFVTSADDITACAQTHGIEEVLIEPHELAREGRISIEQALILAKHAANSGLRAVLVWDILMTQDQFKARSALLAQTDLSDFSAVRAQCPGAALWIRKNLSDKDLHFVVENSNHNLPALERWAEHLQPKRLVLSTQLPEEKLIAYCQHLAKRFSTECEVLGAGKILLFYSKRHLLQANFDPDIDPDSAHWIYTDSSSEESASRPFPTIENEHGTLMFLNKDHFILDKLDRLAEAGMYTIRIDLRDPQGGADAARGIQEICQMTISQDPNLATWWPRPTAAPFFKRNRTDKQFARMKPHTRLLRDANCVAEVVTVERGEVLGLLVLRDFDPCQGDFKFIAHDGSEMSAILSAPADLNGSPITRAEAHRIITCEWIKGVKAGAILVREVG